MNVAQLVELAQKAWAERPTVFGLPGGAMTPEEKAGDLIRLHGLSEARAIALAQDRILPAPWSFEHCVCEVLSHAHEE